MYLLWWKGWGEICDSEHVFVKHGCPRRQQSQNIAKISLGGRVGERFAIQNMCLWNTDAPGGNKVKIWQKSLLVEGLGRGLRFRTSVCETRMPRRQQSQNMAKISLSPTFWPAPPPGACDVSEVWGTDRWTYSPSLVTVLSPKPLILHFVCKLDGVTDRRTNGQTDKQTDRRSNN